MTTTLGSALASIWGRSAPFVRLLTRRTGADLSRQQWDMLSAIDSHSRVVIPKGHSTGGTFGVAGYVLAQLEYYPSIKIVTTAPTWVGVELLLWGDVRKMVRLAAEAGFAFPEPNATDLHVDVSRWAEGISTNDVHRMAGHHELEVRIVIDEAPGVRPDVWSGIDGLRASGNVKVIALGQPLSPTGDFYEACKPGSGWHVYRMDGFESPNLRGLTVAQLAELPFPDQPEPGCELDRIVHPYLVRRRWMRELYKTCQGDETHPHWMGKARALFPLEDEHTLYPLTAIERANVAGADDRDERVVAGVDVAGPGKNETVAIVAQVSDERQTVLALGAWAGRDARGDVLHFLGPWRERLETVRVDEPGMGYYFVQHLRDCGLPAEGVNTGEPAQDGERFGRRRDEVLWKVRERLLAGTVSGLVDEELRSQMAPIRWAPDNRGRTQVEQKGKRAGLAWDRVDALALALADDQGGRSYRHATI